mgnify:CR=1 FL=1|tara:strand:+ start:204 stop:569 length:366 start_codon:yes stop_codon:yes gene_type:complete
MATKTKATKVAKKVEAETTKAQSTLVPNLFINDHTFKTGTTVINIGIKLPDFIDFLQNNKRVDKNGSSWVNIKLIPSSKDNRSHVPVLDNYWHKDAEALANDVFSEDFEKESRAVKNKVTA